MTKRLAVAFPLIYVLVHLCLSMGHGDLRKSQVSSDASTKIFSITFRSLKIGQFSFRILNIEA
jgi:hypothetical protein